MSFGERWDKIAGWGAQEAFSGRRTRAF